jgi:hypothetical protein
MLIFIFLAQVQAEQEDGAACPPAGGQAAARARSFSTRTVLRVRSEARAARALVSALEPLMEPSGHPTRRARMCKSEPNTEH